MTLDFKLLVQIALLTSDAAQHQELCCFEHMAAVASV